MKKQLSWLGLALIALAIFAFPSQAAPPRYVYHDLGTLGGNTSNAYGINDTGRVVGSSLNGSGIWRPYFIELGLPMQDFLAAWGVILGGTAYGINSEGSVVGDFYQTDGANRAFWKSPGTGGSYRDLGNLGGDNSTAYGINSDNQVVGASQLDNGYYRAFRVLDPQTPSMQNLGTLGGNESMAYDVNDYGVVVGSAQDVDGHWLAFSKSSLAKDMISLGVLGGGEESCARAINNLGHVVGYAYNAEWDTRPFLKNRGEAMQDLGTPAGGYGEALDINEAGQVAGNINHEGEWYASLWENGVFYKLKDLAVNLPSNVRLCEAHAINAQGCIAGVAIIDNMYSQAFLLTPAKVYVPLGLLLD
jgi:probable HAF family extracellular repeat protein